MEPTGTSAKPHATAADRELALRLGAVVLSCMRSGGGELIGVLDRSGISFVQMKMLITLGGEHDEPPTVKSVAESLDLSLASASRAVDGLVRQGLVERAEDVEDRRVRRLTLTADGRSLHHRIFAARLDGLAAFAASLDDEERERLESALELLVERDDIARVYRQYRREAGR
jgi:MarR family 2-MHQ and catechol resistance regulon transcriptional repressor